MKHIALLLLACLAALAFCACEEADHPKTQSAPELIVQPYDECPGTLTFADDAATFRLVADHCAVALENATLRLAWYAGQTFHVAAAADYPQRAVEKTDDGYRWTLAGLTGAPAVTVDAQRNDERTQVTMRATVAWPAGSGESIRLAWIELPSADNPAAGVQLPGAAGLASWIQHGHDAWTFTGVEKIKVGEGAPARVQGTVPACANNYDYPTTCHGVSWWFGALASLDRGPGLLWGALTANHWKTHAASWFDHDARLARLVVTQGTPGDERELAPGDTAELEPIWLMLGARPARDLRQYALAAATETPPPESDRVPPFGWGSWYYYFSDIDQTKILDNCARMRELFPNEETLLCQIDDGYQTLHGDWTTYTEGFPDGMAPVAKAIEDLGMLPGIWLAPLMVDPDSALVTDHPDWFLYDKTGQPVLFQDHLSMMTRWALDPTVPAAADFIRQTIAEKVADGYRYLKLDFLFLGAFEGVHADGSTSLEAYHRAMEIIQEAAGDGVYLLACGEPWLPSLGHFHAARDSSDIAGSIPGIPLYTMLPNLGRFHGIRAVFDGVWFATDPDDLVVRWPLTDPQADVSVAATYFGGSENLLGDSLLDLPDDRTNLVASATANALRGLGGEFWAVDLMERTVAWPIATPAFDVAMMASNPPHIWVRANGDERVVALFSWGLFDNDLLFSDHDLAADDVAAWDIELLFGADAGLSHDTNGDWLAHVPGQNVAVYRLTPR